MGDQETRDVAIEDFAAEMKARMDRKAEQGVFGWTDPELVPTPELRRRAHLALESGKYVDVANFAMILDWRSKNTRTKEGR